MFGSRVVREIRGERNAVFRIFNITTYASLVWIAIGLGGQIVFSCRFLIQWIVSERKRESVIPDIFWWISLLGGVCLFVYFVWRRDIVGVLGQSTGIVIYARNIRLIHKKRRRELRNAANGVLTDPASEEANAP
ncbi:MAG: lipid A biosynthesis protein [Phycisphaerales bacterium]|nr:MAG: lipid A biosynthesis protein [Phycisphaerales bacterium]